jgi:hypothetical protein
MLGKSSVALQRDPLIYSICMWIKKRLPFILYVDVLRTTKKPNL